MEWNGLLSLATNAAGFGEAVAENAEVGRHPAYMEVESGFASARRLPPVFKQHQKAAALKFAQNLGKPQVFVSLLLCLSVSIDLALVRH
jgi:hypothetical protein